MYIIISSCGHRHFKIADRGRLRDLTLVHHEKMHAAISFSTNDACYRPHLLFRIQ